MNIFIHFCFSNLLLFIVVFLEEVHKGIMKAADDDESVVGGKAIRVGGKAKGMIACS